MDKNKSKSTGTDFFYENLEREDSLVNRISVVQPKMLPPFFRERTRWQQKLYLFLILAFVSVSIGITAFVMINDFGSAYGLTSGSQVATLIFTFVIWYFVVALSTYFSFWSRRRHYLLSFWDVACGLTSPIFLTAITLIMYFLPGDTFASADKANILILVMGAAAIASAAMTAVMVLIGNILQRRTYPNGFKRSVFLVPGLLVASAALIILWAVGYSDTFETFALDQILYPLLAIVVGGIFFLAGALYAAKYRSRELSSASQWVQLSSSLPSVVVLVTSLIIGFRFANKNEFLTPLISDFICTVVLVFAYYTYLFLRGRIKNINKTNPLYNEFVTRGFVIVMLVLGLLHIAIIPNLISTSKSYAPTSFAILAVSAAGSLAVILGAHFSNIVVYQRFEKLMVFWAALALVVSLIIIFVLGTLNQATIFINVFARGITIALLAAELLNELVILAISAFAVQVDLLRNASPHKLDKSLRAVKEQTKNTRVLNDVKANVVKETNGK